MVVVIGAADLMDRFIKARLDDWPVDGIFQEIPLEEGVWEVRATDNFFVVSWPEHAKIRQFNHDANYWGPFPSIQEAIEVAKAHGEVAIYG